MRLAVRDLGRTDYLVTLRAMRDFTDARTSTTPHQLWLTEHPPVFTQGQAGRAEHLLAPGDIPVVQSDRGGQVTFHGPGQLVGYLLFDIRRLGIGPRQLVAGIERSLIGVLARWGIEAASRPDARGVYVDGAKIASLGLRIRRGCSYHGLALNVDMDLEPFSRIDPCGLRGIRVTQMRELVGVLDAADVKAALVAEIARCFGLDGGPDREREAAAHLSAMSP